MRWLIEWEGEAEQDVKSGSQFLTWAVVTMDSICIGEASWRKNRFVGYVFAFSFRLFKNEHIFKGSTWLVIEPADVIISSKENPKYRHRNIHQGYWNECVTGGKPDFITTWDGGQMNLYYTNHYTCLSASYSLQKDIRAQGQFKAGIR